MKIHAVTVNNYVGSRNIELKLDRPCTLFAGKNAAGKSSLAEAIRHALTGEFTRVELKKDFGHLLTDGEKTGCVIVNTDKGKTGIVLPSGKHTADFDCPESLQYVLSAQRFARLPENDRRTFLFGLMGLSSSTDDVRKQLLAIGCHEKNVEAIIPLLRSGFDAAHTEAKSRARDAKAEWRAVTGETYGAIKAAAWTATKPSFDETKLKHAKAVIEEMDRAIQESSAKLGAMKEQIKAQEARAAKLAGLRQRAAQYARFADKLVVDKAQLAEWDAKVAETRAAAAGMPSVKPLACPDCGSAVIMMDGALVHYVAPEKVADAEAASKLPGYIQAFELIKRSVANDEKQLADADAAAKAIAEIEDDTTQPVQPADIEAMQEHIALVKQHRHTAATDVEALAQAERDAKSADTRQDNARQHHADVQRWEQIADALAPDGIPGKLLQSALEPLNQRIAESAEYTRWLPISVGADMRIMSGTRDYSLLSESEKFRADAMITEAISHLSGVKIIMLDRCDVLDVQGRADLMAWLDEWAESGDIDSALLFATLKEKPLIKFDQTRVIWLADGLVSDGLKAA